MAIMGNYMNNSEKFEQMQLQKKEEIRKIETIKKWINEGAIWGKSKTPPSKVNLPCGHSRVTSFAVSPDERAIVYVVYKRTDGNDLQTFLAEFDDWESYMSPIKRAF